MKSIRTLTLLLVLVVVSACGREATKQAEAPAAPARPLVVAIPTYPGFALPYLAQKGNMFGATKVDIRRMDDAAAINAGMVRGDIDLCFTSVDSFVLAAAQGVDAVAFMMTDESQGADGIVAKKAITSVAGLKGKKVAANLGWPGHFFLLYNLRKNGVPFDAVPITNMDADQAGAAFVSGSLDAAVTWEPWLSKAGSAGNAQILVSTKTMPGVIVDVGLARRQTTMERTADVQAFVNGYYRALAAYRADPTAAAAVMAPALGLKPDDFAAMSQTFRFIDQVEARKALASGQGSVATLFSEAATVWQDAKVVDKPVICQSCTADQFVNAYRSQ